MSGNTGTAGNARAGATRILGELRWRERALCLIAKRERDDESGARLVSEFVFAARGEHANDLWLAVRREAVRLGLGRLLDAPMGEDTIFDRSNARAHPHGE